MQTKIIYLLTYHIMNKAYITGTVIAATLIITSSSTFAFWGGSNSEKPKVNQELRQQIEETIENNDYDAWKALTEDHGKKGNLIKVITEENFSQFAEMHEHIREGEREAAKAIADELGLPQKGRGQGKGMGQRGPQLTEEQRTQLQEAVQGGDYNTWSSLHEELGLDGPFNELITADNFSRFSEMQTLRQSGDREGAKAIAEELGLPNKRPGNNGRGLGQGMGQKGPQLTDEQRTQLQAAIQGNDYEAWTSLHEEYGLKTPMGDLITADNFAQFNEMHELRKAGDFEAAQEIAKELGLPDRPHKKGQRNGLGNGRGYFKGFAPAMNTNNK